MKNIVDVYWLKENINNPSVRVIDCRFVLGSPSEGFNLYMKEHISGAYYFDLEKDLSYFPGVHGGRHPLPSLDRIIDKLSTAGITKETKVVAYDDQGGMMASRFWWMLKYLGHEQVYIVDGGFSKWVSNGFPISNELPEINRKEFEPRLQPQLLSDVEEVKQNISTKKAILIDSRDGNRYAGIEEPIDKKAGHIPGARHCFWKECITDKNEWKSLDELKQFNSLNKDQQIIVYCGSGVSACPNIVALDELGFKNVKLYIGSWSDWISYDDNPIAVGIEE
ncbi:sulfurtransferase [Calidifontibacillus oryziterrae]|uniref:sulfurtransferase n=1 Tax=Calidifontibacillus oryziterrae TaxID=1191699 RepID=UPI0002E2BAD4|nr:sulfurtransferase [Calidifontibacillus oryziterrae]